MFRRFSTYQVTLAEANDKAVRYFTEIERLYLPADHIVAGFVLAKDCWLPEEDIPRFARRKSDTLQCSVSV